MKRLTKNRILVMLAIGLFGLFAVNSAVAMDDVVSSDCTMKAHCNICAVSVSIDTEDNNSALLPFLYNVKIDLQVLESIAPDSLDPPPKR